MSTPNGESVVSAFELACRLGAFPPAIGEAARQHLPDIQIAAQVAAFCIGRDLELHTDCILNPVSTVGGVLLLQNVESGTLIGVPVRSAIGAEVVAARFGLLDDVGTVTSKGGVCVPNKRSWSSWHQIPRR
jgi:hypothetical protein